MTASKLLAAFIFHQYKRKKLNQLIANISRSSDDDPTKKMIPALIKYQDIAQLFEDRWGEDNDAGNLSKKAMEELWEKAQREAELED